MELVLLLLVTIQARLSTRSALGVEAEAEAVLYGCGSAVFWWTRPGCCDDGRKRGLWREAEGRVE